jgi:heme-degrading monooxygenase HmoA
MLVERTELSIKAGQETAFTAEFGGRGVALLGAVPGVVNVSFGRGVENPSKFLLLIEWQDMDAHLAYNLTEVSNEIRAMIRPFAQGASMEHFRIPPED